ncbi:unnamed protein product [Prunus brigantina]
MASGATCVQRLDGSRDSAIHTKYRISLRSSSMREPRYPLPRVVLTYLKMTTPPAHTVSGRRGRALSFKFLGAIRAGVLFDNDPSAGSPTETLLRLLLPLNDKDQPGSIPFRRRLRARQTTLRVECSSRARQSYVSSENASNWTIGGPKTPRPLNAPHPRSQAETCGPSQSHDEPWVDRDTSTATMSSCCPRRARGGKGQREAPFLNNR